MTIWEASKKLSATLNTVYEKREAEKIAEMVIENITGFTRSEKILHKQDLLLTDQLEKFENYTAELLRHKPVQYVLRKAWFAGLKLYVDENVLIPRPETEELVDLILRDLSSQKLPGSKILDVGTGSGCIAIALNKKISSSAVYALDISAKALEISKENAVANNVNINFIEADILNIDSEIYLPDFDIIVSNPPYVTHSEAQEMDENVLLHEPELALFVPNNHPLIFYEAIADFAISHLNKENGKLYFEINEMMGEKITTMLLTKGFSDVILKKDFQNKDRMISATLKK